MTAKEYLEQVEKLDVLINQRMKQKNSIHIDSGIGGIDYSKDKVMSSPAGEGSFVKPIEALVSLEQEIDDLIDTFVDTKNRIIGEIQGLKNVKHIDLLFKRYVEYKSFQQIADEMKYCYQYTVELHKAALTAFETTYKNLFDSD